MRLTSFSAHAFVLTMSMAFTLASATTPTTNVSRSGSSPFVWILIVLALVVAALAVRRELRKRTGKLPSQQASDKAPSAPSGVTGVRVAPSAPPAEVPVSQRASQPAPTPAQATPPSQPKPAPAQAAPPAQPKPAPTTVQERTVITPKPVEQPVESAPARSVPPAEAPRPAPQSTVAPVAAAAPAPAKSDDLMDGFAFLGLGDFGGTLAPASGWLSSLKTHPERVRGLSLEGGLALVHDDAGNNAAVPLGADVGEVLDVPALRGLRLSVSDQGARVVALPNGVYLVQGGTPLAAGSYLKPGVLYGLGVGTPPIAAASSFTFGSVLGAPNVEQFTSGGIDVKLLQNGRRLTPNLDPARAHLIFIDDKLDVGQAYGISSLGGLLIDQQDEAAHLHALPTGVALWQGTSQLNLGHTLEKGTSYRLSGAGLDGYTLEWHG
ncbi:hypothetical protein [Deinococcus yavapaiensis]|uniref:Uncharacterized protein n=1 Tax=Deinococcus yavapaiensis KR-236 TaxID=694435 RepID=A0A318SA32_9DEIO|nr:hypothetical protein [Deinococcus yavapaiensis]PYE55238.1 hypothetical protein DES52_10368 [Deinococcus yavapaiensis KR-236]